MNKDSKILVTGHTGLVGSALIRRLTAAGFTNLMTWPHKELDLRRPDAAAWAFSSYLPEYVFHCAARVGGIVANRDNPVEFVLDNLHMELNVIENAHKWCKKMMFFGTACAYPKLAPIPVREDSLLTGPLEWTNEKYALAKIMGLKLCEAYHGRSPCEFVSVMPTNLLGLNDNYHLENSHVVPGMIRRLHEAKEAGKDSVTLWGTGTPKRDFLYSDDLADACILIMQEYHDPVPINIASGQATRLCDLAKLVQEAVGFHGWLKWDTSRPDGTPDRTMDITKLRALGWFPKVTLREGLKLSYADFLKGGRR